MASAMRIEQSAAAVQFSSTNRFFGYFQHLVSTLLRKIIKPMARQRHPFICISCAPSLLEMTVKSFSWANYYDLSNLIPSETLFRDICVMRLKNGFLLKNYLKFGIFQNVLIVDSLYKLNLREFFVHRDFRGISHRVK